PQPRGLEQRNRLGPFLPRPLGAPPELRLERPECEEEVQITRRGVAMSTNGQDRAFDDTHRASNGVRRSIGRSGPASVSQPAVDLKEARRGATLTHGEPPEWDREERLAVAHLQGVAFERLQSPVDAKRPKC